MSITFLFGSGADTDACSELMSGQSFSESLLTGKFNKEVSSLLGNDFSSFRLVYPTSIKVFVQTIVSFSKKARGVLDDETVDEIIKYDNDKSVKFENIREKCRKFYQILSSDRSEDQKIKEFFCKNAVFFDSLDEKFNSLRHKTPNDNAKRVMNAYTTIFVLMMTVLYNTDGLEWSFDKVFEKLKQKYDIEIEPGSYYQQLKESDISCNVITTNYTDLAKIETDKETIFLHGKLTWFEDLDDMSVYDCTNDNERMQLLDKKRIIPYILIPSGVKPLICSKQIKQFSAFIDKLENSDELCVVGYRFNSEDDHINSIIAEWLREDNHRLVYFNFDNDVDFALLKWAQKFSINSVSFSEKGIMQMSHDKIQDISVNCKNSRQAFGDYLRIAAGREI